MKTLTISSIIATFFLVNPAAHAQSKVSPISKQVAIDKEEDMKRGPLADFYELVAQQPSESRLLRDKALQSSVDKSTASVSLADTGSSKNEPAIKPAKQN